jgi:hypothetical protein
MILLIQKLVSCNDMLRKGPVSRSQTFIARCLLILMTSCGQGSQEKNKFTINAPAAPEVNSKYWWLNTDRSYSLMDLRGKIVLLDFWTFGRINCQHIMSTN